MKIRILSLLFLASFFLVACNRDKEAPVINITSPAPGETVDPGGTFSFQATVTDNEALESITFTDGGGLTEFISSFDEVDMHALNYNITISEDSDPGELNVMITAEDIEGNRAEDDFTITIN